MNTYGSGMAVLDRIWLMFVKGQGEIDSLPFSQPLVTRYTNT